MEERDVVGMNAKGTQLLRAGKRSEAACVFRQALKQLLNGFVRDPDDECLAPGVTTHLIQSVEIEDSSISSCKKFLDQNTFAFFEKAFIINATDDGGLCDYTNQNLMSTVLLFNLGLSFHLAGVSQAMEQKANLTKALKLYTMAVDVLTAEIGVMNTPLMSLALANNMGSIYSHFFEAEEVSNCLDWIRCILEETCHRLLGEIEDYSVFHMNVMLLEDREVNQVAAAA